MTFVSSPFFFFFAVDSGPRADGFKHSITQFYLKASSLSPKSTLKTAILCLSLDLNSLFGHSACFWIVTSEEINPFIKNAWPGSIYCLALQSLCSALIYQLWRNYKQSLSHAMWFVFVNLQILVIILLFEKGTKIYYISLCYHWKGQRKTLVLVGFIGEQVFTSTHPKWKIFFINFTQICANPKCPLWSLNNCDITSLHAYNVREG